MALFLVFSIPLFCLFVAMLSWDPMSAPRKLSLLSVFFWGLLCFIPGALILAVLKAIVGSPLTGLPLYLSLLLRDHLAPLLLAVGAFILVQRKLDFPAALEGIFLTAFVFLCGFYSLFGLAIFIRLFGHWDVSDLFLLPLLRIAAILLVSMGASRFYRWQGRSAAAYLGVAAGLCLPLALIGWLYGVNFRWISTVCVIAAFCTAAAVFIGRFPRALGIGRHAPERL
jgi:hypothetical protein